MSVFSFVRSQFSDSARALRRAQTLALTGVMLAAQIALSSYGSIRLTDSLWISLGHLALAPTAMLFGPVVAGMQGALSDILSYILRPSGPYFPGFTLSALLGGVIYGMALYKAKPTAPRVVIGRLVVVVLLNILLNTVFLMMLYGASRLATMPARAIKSLLQWPVDCILLMAVCRLVQRMPASLTRQ